MSVDLKNEATDGQEVRTFSGRSNDDGSSQRREFVKSVLKIEVPVSVTIARREMPVEKIVALAPGSMIQFNKACDLPMELEIDEHLIADCEVVKVGDRFGVKITNVVGLPEKYVPLIQEKQR